MTAGRSAGSHAASAWRRSDGARACSDSEAAHDVAEVLARRAGLHFLPPGGSVDVELGQRAHEHRVLRDAGVRDQGVGEPDAAGLVEGEGLCLRKKPRGEILTGLQIRSQDTRYRAGRAFSESLYPPDHPYHYSTRGTQETIPTLTIDELRAFRDRNFGPRGMVIVVVGAILIARRRIVAGLATEEGQTDEVLGPATPVSDNPHSIPVYGTDNPHAKAYPET